MNWKLVIFTTLGGWGFQGAAFALFTRQWFVELAFPGVEGWGFWAANLTLMYAFLFVVLPVSLLGVVAVIHRSAPARKWRNTLAAMLLTALPVLVLTGLALV